MEKKWWESKTLWTNTLAVVALVVQGKLGYVISPEDMVIAMGVINVILRAITKHEVVWS